jgi:F0F1-type ATP synthase assembly protein I
MVETGAGSGLMPRVMVATVVAIAAVAVLATTVGGVDRGWLLERLAATPLLLLLVGLLLGSLGGYAAGKQDRRR